MKNLTTFLKLTLAISAMTFGSQALATDVIFQENFNTPLDRWESRDLISGATNSWRLVSSAATIFPPANNSRVGNDAWLINTAVEMFPLTQNVPVLVTFQVRRPSASALESLRVHIHTNRVAEYMATTAPIWQIQDLPISDWVTVRVRFVPPTSGDFAIGFHAKSPMHNNTGTPGVADGGTISIRNLVISQEPQNSLAIERLPFQFTQIGEGTPPPVVKVTNVGSETQTNVVVSALINGEPTPLPAFTLASGETRRVGFPAVNGQRDTLTRITVVSDAVTESPDTLLRTGGITYIGTPNVWAQDRGAPRIPTNNIAARGPGSSVGMVYEFTEAINLSQVMLYFPGQSTEEFRVELFRIVADTLNPTAVFSQPTRRTGILGWQTVNITHDSPILPGKYFLAVSKSAGATFFVGADGDPSRFFYDRPLNEGGMPSNRIAPVQRSHTFAENGNGQTGASLIGGLIMRLIMETTTCTSATDLAADPGPGSATFTWTAAGTGSQTLTLLNGTDTIRSTLLDGQTNRYVLMDALIPGQTGYTWSVTTHCDASPSNSRLAQGPLFNAATCDVPVIVVTDATIPHGINFEDDIFLCLVQQATRLSDDGDSASWVRSNTVWSRPPNTGFQLAERTVLAMGMGTQERPRTPGDSLASTKLILPTFDLSGISTTADPMLRIRRAATRVSQQNDVADTLRVHYRTSPTQQWRLLTSVGNATDEPNSTVWTNDANIITLELDRSPTLQLAFEGVLTESGGGIYIDSMWFYSATIGQIVLEELTPRPGADSVGVRAPITARFSRNIREGTNFGSITIRNMRTDSIYPVTASIVQSRLNISTQKLFDTTTYTVHIPAGAVANHGGSFINRDTSWSFRTGREAIGVDDGSFSPRHDQMEVRVDTDMVITFVNNVISADPDSLKKIVVRRVAPCATGDTLVAIDTVPNIDARIEGVRLIITTPNDLRFSATYQVIIPAYTLDHQTNEILAARSTEIWHFTTQRLVVNWVVASPAPSATNVPINTPVFITYNRALADLVDSTLLDQVTLRNNADSTYVEITVRIDDRTIHFDRIGDLKPNTQYTATVPARFVLNDFQQRWHFTTGTEIVSILEPISSEHRIVIHPNPVSDVLYIQSEEPILRVEIFNLQGQQIRQINGAISELSVSELSTGIYVLKVTTAKGVATLRFVKQ